MYLIQNMHLLHSFKRKVMQPEGSTTSFFFLCIPSSIFCSNDTLLLHIPVPAMTVDCCSYRKKKKKEHRQYAICQSKDQEIQSSIINVKFSGALCI